MDIEPDDILPSRDWSFGSGLAFYLLSRLSD